LNANPLGLYAVGEKISTVGPRGLASVRCGLLTSSCDLGGVEELEELEEEEGDVDIAEVVEVPGRGAIGIVTSPVLL
jgi:hypothetical protein